MWPRIVIALVLLGGIGTAAFIKGMERGVTVAEDRHQQEIEAIYDQVEEVLHLQREGYEAAIEELVERLRRAEMLRTQDQQREQELHDRIRGLSQSLSEMQGRIYETDADIGYCDLTSEFDRMFTDASREGHAETRSSRED